MVITPSPGATGAVSLRRPPPCVPMPLVGDLPFLLGRRLDGLAELRARFGDMFELNLGFMKLVAMNHPDHAQHVLRDRARIYGKGNRLWDSIRGLIGNGLPVSEGEFWRRQRRMIQPHFHRERLASMTGLMVAAIDEELAGWDHYAATGRPVDLFREMTRITMRVIVKTMFGTQLSADAADIVGHEMGYALDYMMLAMLTSGLPGWVPVPGRKRFQAAVAKIDEGLFGLIERRKLEPHQEGGELISMLLDSVDAETSQRMTAGELRDEAMAMFLAGYETTSSTLAFAFHHLLHSPQSLTKLITELDTELAGRLPQFSDLRRLPYSLAVVQEALRLHGPVYWIPRTAQEDDEVCGFQIRKGEEVGVMVYAIHRHPELWSDPLRFDPSRFSSDQVERRHPLAWIPFGVGQRLCVGKEFALMEGQLILARILSRYTLTLDKQRSLKVHVGTTLRPASGIWVQVHPRTPPARCAVA